MTLGQKARIQRKTRLVQKALLYFEIESSCVLNIRFYTVQLKLNGCKLTTNKFKYLP